MSAGTTSQGPGSYFQAYQADSTVRDRAEAVGASPPPRPALQPASAAQQSASATAQRPPGPTQQALTEQLRAHQARLGELQKTYADLKKKSEETAEEKEGSKQEKTELTKYYYTQREFWGGPTLSYMVYTALAIIPITGLLGMDHMYMRSPGTGLIKAILNVFTLGFWYFYDVVQAITDQESVTEFGVSMPLYGPSGIGAGSFVKEDEAKADNGSPGSFLMFAIATFILPFGIEYIIAGDFGGFIGKFLMSFIGIGLIYGIINSLELIQHPERVLCQGTKRYWPVTWWADDMFTETTFGNKIQENCPEMDGGIGGWFSGIFGNLFKKIPILGTLYEETKEAAKMVKKSVVEGVGTLKQASEIAKEIPGSLQAAQAVVDRRATRGGGNNGSASSTILTFTLALVFIGAAFLKGKDIMTAVANKNDGRLNDIGSFIWRKKNVVDLPPTAPES